jgi:two-component system phosphate regulon sensor histidine kinase PhoR
LRLRTPTTRVLGRARLVFTLTALVPTILMSVLGIVLLTVGPSPSVALVAGILVLCFCAVGLAGYTIGTFFVTRGASLAAIQNEFLALVSHELRTPLTSIRLFIDTLREGRVREDAEKHQCLSIIVQELNRLDGLVGRLIDLSKIQHRHGMFERSVVHVDHLVADALAAFDAVRIGGEVALEVGVQSDMLVMGDRAALAQAVGNLLANAWKYTPAQGKRIALVATGDNRHVTISVTDNGDGIANSERDAIFEKFQRGSAARQRGNQGAGLGLAIVRGVVEAHRGTVDVKSDGVHGARFRIILPRHREAA